MLLKSEHHPSKEINASHKLCSQACGKAIIVGEHAAIHGARAVAIPLKNLKVELKLSSEHQDHSVTFADNVGEKIHDKNFSFELSKLLQRAFELFDKPFEPLVVDIKSNIIIGSGLGSSAALCVSLIRFLSFYFKKNYEAAKVAELANELEKIFHGNPSGLDTTVISFEKPIVYQRNKTPSFIEVKPLIMGKEPKPWPFVLIDTNERAPTYLMVEKTKPFFQGDSGKKRIEKSQLLANQVIEAFKNHDFEQMVQAINSASKSLEELGIFTKRAKEITLRARELGVPAIKITGSGGGGCLLALLNPNKQELQLKSLSENFGHDKVFKIFL